MGYTHVLAQGRTAQVTPSKRHRDKSAPKLGADLSFWANAGDFSAFVCDSCP